MDGLAQGWNLHRAVRIVGQQRLTGGGHGPVYHPVVAALLGGEGHWADGLLVNANDVLRDVREVEAAWNLDGSRRIERKELLHGGGAEAAHLLSPFHFAGQIARHQ
jgi:hypothetical protein